MIDHCPASPQELYLDGLELILGESRLETHRQESDLGSLPIQKSDLNTVARHLLNRVDRMSAEGLSLMAGREEFSTLLRLCGEETHLLDSSIRMLPPRRRIVKGLGALLTWLDSAWGIKSSFKSEGQAMVIAIPVALREPEGQISQIAVSFVQGLLEGMLTWISGGKFYPARIERSADEIGIFISRDPID